MVRIPDSDAKIDFPIDDAERRSLAPALREHVAEQLLERYLAEQASVDILDRRHTYTKHIRNLTPMDLPA